MKDGTKTVRLDNKLAGDYTKDEFRALLAAVWTNQSGGEPPGMGDTDYRKHSYRFNDIVNVRQEPETGVWAVIGYAATN